MNGLQAPDLINNSQNSTVKKPNEKKDTYTEVNLLLNGYIDDNHKNERRMLNVSLPVSYNTCSNMIVINDVLAEHFPTDVMLKDDLGYKLVNDHTERRINVITVINEYDIEIKYLVNIESPSMRLPELVNFSKLLNSKKFSDVTLRVHGRGIYAHKNILSNQSPVFEAMFTHEMSESQSKIVEIKDIDYDTMYDFLHYIYSGKVKDDKCYSGDVFVKYSNLLIAANKYCVDSLKLRCEQKLPIFLTKNNVLDCLLLADTHNAVNLKKEAIDYIVENVEEIVELPSYKDFLVHADISIEIVRALLVKRKKN